MKRGQGNSGWRLSRDRGQLPGPADEALRSGVTLSPSGEPPANEPFLCLPASEIFLGLAPGTCAAPPGPAAGRIWTGPSLSCERGDRGE